MAYKDRVQLMPKVPDRGALLWNKEAIESKDYEVYFTLSGSMPTGSDGNLAFWLSPDNFASSFDEKAVLAKVEKNKKWIDSLNEAGLSFLSNKPDFKGLALMFLPFDRQQNQKQSMASIWSDGSKKMPSNIQDFLKDPNIKIATNDWLHFGMQVKVRVKADGSILLSKRDIEPGRGAGSVWSWAPNGEDVEGEFTLTPERTVIWNREAPAGSWDFRRGGKLNVTIKGTQYELRLDGNRAIQEIPDSPHRGVAFYGSKESFRAAGEGGEFSEDAPWQQFAAFPAGTLTVPVPKTYIGFSGYTGTTGMEVELNTLQTISYDSSASNVNDLAFGNHADWMKVLKDEAAYIDKASQSEAIERIAKLLSDHVLEDTKNEDQLRADLLQMEGRMEELQTKFGVYLSTLESWSPVDEKLDPKVVREHMGKVSTLLTQGKEVHAAKLNEIQTAAVQLKDAHSSGGLGEASKQKVRDVAGQAKKVQDYASAGSSQNTIFLLIIIVAVSGLGFLFFQRMRYYEKKHFI